MTDEKILALWRAHRDATLPEVPRECRGELWVLDEVIGGCVTYFLDAGRTLDPPRVVILKDCRADLERLLPDLEEGAASYFSRLRTLAGLLLQASQEGGKS